MFVAGRNEAPTRRSISLIERRQRSSIPEYLPVTRRSARSGVTSYTCPDCLRPAAKKCSMSVRRCIAHCQASHCSATGHSRTVRMPFRVSADSTNSVAPRFVHVELSLNHPSANQVRDNVAQSNSLTYSAGYYDRNCNMHHTRPVSRPSLFARVGTNRPTTWRDRV